MIEEILRFNQAFVENRDYEKYLTDKYPAKRVAIVTCMDARLTELLPAALGLRNGDAKLIKNAGGVISHPFGSVMRSLLIGVYDLDIREIFVIGHTDCGARLTDVPRMMEKMKSRGIQEQSLEMIRYHGINLEKWLGGFADLECSVQTSVELIKKHPLMPEGVEIYGLIIDSVTGELTRTV